MYEYAVVLRSCVPFAIKCLNSPCCRRYGRTSFDHPPQSSFHLFFRFVGLFFKQCRQSYLQSRLGGRDNLLLLRPCLIRRFRIWDEFLYNFMHKFSHNFFYNQSPNEISVDSAYCKKAPSNTCSGQHGGQTNQTCLEDNDTVNYTVRVLSHL